CIIADTYSYHYVLFCSPLLTSLSTLFPYTTLFRSTFVYSVRFIGQIFLGSYKPDSLPKPAHEVSKLMLISPSILAILVIVFGFFPSILTGSIIEPAVNAISHTTGTTAEFHMFHGFTPAFFSTLGIYIVGILLIFSFGYWISLLKAQPTKLTINYWYNKLGAVTPSFSSQFTNTYVTGFTRNNLLMIFASLIIITLVTLLVTPFSINFKD